MCWKIEEDSLTKTQRHEEEKKEKQSKEKKP
jgi:hypothetical protein